MRVIKFADSAKTFCKLVNVVSDKLIVMPLVMRDATPTTINHFKKLFGKKVPTQFQKLLHAAKRLKRKIEEVTEMHKAGKIDAKDSALEKKILKGLKKLGSTRKNSTDWWSK
uniref:Uncharacterized protein n=1 Tax=Ditylenchus dipsaci TaxID=166011 RepID=A0A915ET97_9BILA